MAKSGKLSDGLGRRRLTSATKKVDSPSHKKPLHRPKRSERGTPTDYISWARTCGILLLICAIGGFLFYPDIVSAVRKVGQPDDANDSNSNKPVVETDAKINRGEREIHEEEKTTQFSREGDLMEDEFESVESQILNTADSSVVDLDIGENDLNIPQGNKAIEEEGSKIKQTKIESTNANHKTKTDNNENEQIVKQPKKLKEKKQKKSDDGNDSDTGVRGVKHTKPPKTQPHDKEKEVKRRDGKRKPIILRPGMNEELTIDLVGGMDGKAQVQDKRKVVVGGDKQKHNEEKPTTKEQKKSKDKKELNIKSNIRHEEKPSGRRKEQKDDERSKQSSNENGDNSKEKAIGEESMMGSDSEDMLPTVGRDGKSKPIILSGDNNQVTIDAANIKGDMKIEVNSKKNRKSKSKSTKTEKNLSENEKSKARTKSTTNTKEKSHASGNSESDRNNNQRFQQDKTEQPSGSNIKNEKLKTLDESDKKSPNLKSKQNNKPSPSHKASSKSKTKETKATNEKENAAKVKVPSHKASSKSKTKETKDTNEKDKVAKFKVAFQKTFTPQKIFQDGRRIPPVELLPQKKTNSSVKVYLFNEFLSDRECEGLMNAHDNHVKAMGHSPLLCFNSMDTLRRHLKEIGHEKRVTPHVFTKGTYCLNASYSLEIQNLMNSNWSYSTAFYPGESAFSKAVDVRMQRAMGLNPENGGKFQITSYPLGKAYKTHTDCVLEGADERDRVVSVLMYLNTVDDGGETRFPELGIWVKPRKGRAIVWNNMSPKGFCESHSQHVASVVKKGSKYILIRWYYFKNFPSLGTRIEPPPLPARNADVPMVMCDEYNMGSCRWYDEWSYNTLTSYDSQKGILLS